MLAQFSIWPLDNPHLSRDINDVAQVLGQSRVRYEVGPMGTTVEGDWHSVMEAVHACHKFLRGSHQRIVTTITIDDDATRSLKMENATSKISADVRTSAD